jgi:hypothetical protein
MMTRKSPISHFEDFARELIEGSVDRLLGDRSTLVEVAGALALAAESSRLNETMANHYTVKLHPSTLSQLLQQTPDAVLVLVDVLTRLAAEERTDFSNDTHIEFEADANLKEGKVEVTAGRVTPEDEPTAVLQRKKGATAPLELLDAYLIVGGRRHVAVDQPVNSIGRSLENDIVLEDPGVSRRHAQIRWRNGRFVLLDLGSRAGTQVNNRPASEHELKSGDIITLGGAIIIYGEEGDPEEPKATGQEMSDDITRELSRDELP